MNNHIKGMYQHQNFDYVRLQDDINRKRYVLIEQIKQLEKKNNRYINTLKLSSKLTTIKRSLICLIKGIWNLYIDQVEKNNCIISQWI